MSLLKKKRQRIIVGLTGSFGSGKTTVTRIFKSLGAKVIDADAIAHSLLNPRTKIYHRIIAAFGKGILARDSRIDRRKLAAVVFGNEALVRKLNRLTHPAIIRTIKKKIRGFRKGIVVLDAPLLVEAGLMHMTDMLVVVATKKDIQIRRIVKKTGLSKAAIVARIKRQIPLKDKLRLADFIIDNNAAINRTKKQVQEVWEKLNYLRS